MSVDRRLEPVLSAIARRTEARILSANLSKCARVWTSPHLKSTCAYTPIHQRHCSAFSRDSKPLRPRAIEPSCKEGIGPSLACPLPFCAPESSSLKCKMLSPAVMGTPVATHIEASAETVCTSATRMRSCNSAARRGAATPYP
eukprot:scaffold4916_cov28-Tisochrysis_lutea.AAC.2